MQDQKPDPKMSKQFNDREVELQKEREEKAKLDEQEEVDALNEATNHYVAPAKEYQIANFVPEKREGGDIVRREVPLRFFGHIKSTKDPKEVAFIENSDAFKAGVIKKYGKYEDAQQDAAQRDVLLDTVRTVTTEMNVRQAPI